MNTREAVSPLMWREKGSSEQAVSTWRAGRVTVLAAYGLL